MSLAVLALGLAAAAVAAGSAFCDGVLLALDPDAPPAVPRLAGIGERRERIHRALAFARVAALLVAGATMALGLHMAARPRWEAWLVVAGVGGVVVALVETTARTAGDLAGPRILPAVAPWLERAERWLAPVVWLGDRLDTLLAQLLPAVRDGERAFEQTVERFREVVAAEADVSRRSSVILNGVFALGDTTVEAVMTPRVDIVGVEATAPWAEALARVRAGEHARLPVYDGTLDEVVGVLYAKDLLPAVVAETEPAGGWRAVVRPATFIPTTKRADVQLREFKATGRHIAVVVDEYGGTAGLVTIEDLLELIVGDIRDEYDHAEPEVEAEEGRRFWVSSRVTLDQLSDLAGADFSRGDITTVGGLVYELLGRVPRAGESLTVQGFRLVIERVRRRRVERVYLERVEEPVGRADR
jgi:CBS domain containing-hemolysin-like protein